MKSKLNPLFAFVVLAATAHGAALTWDTTSGDGATITPGNGTWQTGSGNWNNTGSDVNWTAGDTAIFAGSDGTYTITIGGAVTTGNSAASGITFNNSGYTLTSSTARTITLGNTSSTASAITVAANKTATIGGSVTVTKGGSGNTGVPYITGGGTLVLGGGAGDASVLQNTGSNPSEIRGGTTLEVKAGGTFTNGTSMIVGVGSGTAENGLTNQLKVAGGTVNVNTNNLIVGQLSGSQSSSAIVTISSGLIDIKGATGSLRLGQSSSGTADVTINLDGGTISTARVYENPGTPAVTTFNFNGGTLKNFATNFATTYMQGLDTAQIRNGSAVIDTNNIETTIAQDLLHSDIGGDNSIDGGVKKLGLNTLNLTGDLSYTGPTVIDAGKLAVTAPASINDTTLNNIGSRLKVTSGTSPSSLPSLTLNTGTGVEFDLGVYNELLQPSVTVGILNAKGNYVIDVSGSSIPFNAPITLLTYTSKTGTGVPSIGNLPPGVTLSGPPVDNGSSIVINVLNGSAAAFDWSAGKGNWDTVSLNWNGNTALYSEPAVVTFPDLGGNAQYSVNVTANRAPSAVNLTNTGDFDSATAYTFTGAGGIIGATGIKKAGSGLVTFSNPNAYAGVLSITSGAVVKALADNTTGNITVADGAGFALSGGVSDGGGQTITLAGPGNVSNFFYSGSATQRGSLQAQSGSNTWAGNIVLTGTAGGGGNTRIGLQNGASLTLSGAISEGVVGMSPLFRGGGFSDVITFAGICSWTGTTRFFSDGGTFTITADDMLPTTSDLAVGTSPGSGGGAFFDLAGYNQTVAALGGSTDSSIGNSESSTSTLILNPVVANGYNGIIQDDVALVIGGSANESLGGLNTYTGNTVIQPGAFLTVLSTAGLQFYPTTSGVTNSVDGSGTLIYDGTIQLDTSNTDTTAGNSWTLINTSSLKVTFGDGLAIASHEGEFAETSTGSGIWTFADGDNITWTFTESDGKLTIGAPVTDVYAGWINSYFPGETNQAIIGKGADPDNDGVNNLAEFALAGVPNSGSNDGYHVVGIEDTDSDTLKELTLTIAVRNAGGSPAFSVGVSPSATVDGITYTVQGSLDLVFPESPVSETAGPAGLPALPTGWEYRRFRLDASEPLGNRGFLRVETKPAP